MTRDVLPHASGRAVLPSARGRDAGFTLLEVLAALTVLGFLMLALTQGVRFGLVAWERQSRATATRSELDALDRVLRRLIEQMDPGTRRDPPIVAGAAGSLEFRTNLGPAAGPLSVRDAEVRLAVEGGRLVLRWRPHLRAIRFAAPPPPNETELLRGLSGLEISYWGAAGWQPSWTERALPTLIRLRLRFAAGDQRRWPDIVVAPLREAPGR
jgi:general secretion pathway protein J